MEIIALHCKHRQNHKIHIRRLVYVKVRTILVPKSKQEKSYTTIIEFILIISFLSLKHKNESKNSYLKTARLIFIRFLSINSRNLRPQLSASNLNVV